MDFLPVLPAFAEILGAIVAIVLGFLTLRKKAYLPAKEAVSEVLAAVRGLNGYAAVLDPATGTVLKPETPSLPRRVENVEQAVLLLTSLETELAQHLAWAEGWTKEAEDRFETIERHIGI